MNKMNNSFDEHFFSAYHSLLLIFILKQNCWFFLYENCYFYETFESIMRGCFCWYILEVLLLISKAHEFEKLKIKQKELLKR